MDRKPQKSRVRMTDFPLPDWVRRIPWAGGVIRDRRTAAELRLQAFEASVHPADNNIARIIRNLDIGLDDWTELISALREPGSSKPLNRPPGSSRKRPLDDAMVRKLSAELGRPLTRADCRMAAERLEKPIGSSAERDAKRFLERAKALGLT